jgi:hypothetical protein
MNMFNAARQPEMCSDKQPENSMGLAKLATDPSEQSKSQTAMLSPSSLPPAVDQECGGPYQHDQSSEAVRRKTLDATTACTRDASGSKATALNTINIAPRLQVCANPINIVPFCQMGSDPVKPMLLLCRPDSPPSAQDTYVPEACWRVPVLENGQCW